jgi:hypothetical protein
MSNIFAEDFALLVKISLCKLKNGNFLQDESTLFVRQRP